MRNSQCVMRNCGILKQNLPVISAKKSPVSLKAGRGTVKTQKFRSLYSPQHRKAARQVCFLQTILLFLFKCLINYGCDCRADKRTYDEYPEACKRLCIACDCSCDCGTDASCRVNRCACKADAQDMNKNKRKAYNKAAEAAVACL